MTTHDTDERPVEHDYLSTACYHALHPRCRKVCKFCAVECNCPCHQAALGSTSE